MIFWGGNEGKYLPLQNLEVELHDFGSVLFGHICPEKEMGEKGVLGEELG